MKHFITRMWKALGAALAGVTAVNVDWVTNEIFTTDFPHEIDTAIATVLAFGIVYWFPKNKAKTLDDSGYRMYD